MVGLCPAPGGQISLSINDQLAFSCPIRQATRGVAGPPVYCCYIDLSWPPQDDRAPAVNLRTNERPNGPRPSSDQSTTAEWRAGRAQVVFGVATGRRPCRVSVSASQMTSENTSCRPSWRRRWSFIEQCSQLPYYPINGLSSAVTSFVTWPRPADVIHVTSSSLMRDHWLSAIVP